MIIEIINFVLEHAEGLKLIFAIPIFLLVGFLMSKVIKHNKDAVENARVLLEDGSYRSPTKEEKYEIARIINWRCGSWAKLLLIIAIIILIAVICVINLFFK